jgi:D-alanyl-D-alanine dipeptidase
MSMLLLSAPFVHQIPVRDCGERLVSLKDFHRTIRIDESASNIQCLGYEPDFSVRETVAKKLEFAAQSLPENVHLLVKETLRPASFQEFCFNRRFARLSREHPELSSDAVFEKTSMFIAPPHVAGHPTGGAFDVTLCSSEGVEFDMGCGYDEDEVTSKGACFSVFADLCEEAKSNRQLLFSVLQDQGFVNYPFEWWHWSYGDRYWAAITGAPEAIYLATEIDATNSALLKS